MKKLATVVVLIIAIIHLAIAGVEIFFWMNPIVHERLDLTTDVARQVAPIVKNVGLYNGFIASGLIWGSVTRNNALPIRGFFLTCVIIAGIFGAITLKPTTLVLQTIPAAIALFLSWKAIAQD